MPETTLSAFGTDSHSPGQTAVAQSARLSPPPKDHEMGPWEKPDTEYGLKTRRLSNRQRTPSGPPAEPYHARWVVGGDLASYVDEYGSGNIFTIPMTFDGFKSIEPIIGRVDSLTPDKEAYGWGINGAALERAFRILTEGGRYNAERYKVIPCGDKPWILTGPEGTLLCSLVPVEKPDDTSDTTRVEIEIAGATVEVEEENPRVLSGIRRFGSLLAEKNIFLTYHYDPTKGFSNYLKFEDQEDGSHKIKPQSLASLSELKVDPGNVKGSSEVWEESPSGKQVRISWEGPEHQVGEEVDDKLFAGWKMEWDNPTYSPESVPVIAKYHLKHGRSWKLDRRVDRLTTER